MQILNKFNCAWNSATPRWALDKVTEKGDEEDNDVIWKYAERKESKQDCRGWGSGKTWQRFFQVWGNPSYWATVRGPSSRTYRKTSFQRCHSTLTDTRTNVWLFVGSGNKWQQGKRALHKYMFLSLSPFLSSSFLSLLSALFFFVCYSLSF